MKANSSQLAAARQDRHHAPSFAEALRFWLKLGFISFGGPTGQIAIMQTELVEKKKWISQSRFLHALNFCMLLPGPEAQQLAIYIGWLLHRTWGCGVDESVLSDAAESPEHTRPSWARAIKLIFIWVALWFAPTVAVGLWRGWQSTLFQEGLFFSKAAVVTFGGAYAVLPYVAQQALFHYGWLKPGQMMDGLGLAETTPGPLIMVLQFVGFMGAWQHPEGLPPLVAATIGALITTWATFTPCFLWIFVGGPYIEQLRGNPKLTAPLSAITAAIVGVVLNLAVWFGLRVFFPAGGAVDWFATLLCAAAFVAMLRYKIDIIPVLVGAGILGLLYNFLRGFS